MEIFLYVQEFVTGIIGAELVMDLRYRLIMICIPTDGTYPLYGDSMSGITNWSITFIVHHKKHDYIAYHKVREAVSETVFIIYRVSININISYLLTNPLVTIKYYTLMRKLLRWIFKEY